MRFDKQVFGGVAVLAIFAAGFVLGGLTQSGELHAQSGDRVFELRTYTTNPGKLPNLQARFRDHTMRIFEQHGMANVGYWTPQDAPSSANTLIYIISHPSREAAANNWKEFGADPEWQEVARESQVDGQILAKRPDSVFMDATDFSPMK
jgi:hypothetical protein